MILKVIPHKRVPSDETLANSNKKPCVCPWACIGLQTCAMQIKSHARKYALKRMTGQYT
jgi:hypothetical protein